MSYIAWILSFLIMGDCILGQKTLPFSTPLTELNRIHTECERKGIQGITETKKEARKCLTNANANNLDTDDPPNGLEMSMTNSKCEIRLKQKECWNPVIQKINSCIPKRGDTVGKIFMTLGDTVCQNSGETGGRSTQDDEEKCVPMYHSVECNKTEDMLSADLCRSFKSQYLCEESALGTCQNKEHKSSILKNLKEAEKVLKCSASSNFSIYWITFASTLLYFLNK